MTHPQGSNQWNPDVARVAQEMTSRLRTRGVDVFDADTPDDIVQLLEAVEDFERTVESAGGDLMVDEPPKSGSAQPDNPDFLLPRRAADESVSNYVRRLNVATSRMREDGPGS